MMQELYNKIKSLEPITLACHDDADGLYSATLIRRLFKVKNVSIPKTFGDYATQSIYGAAPIKTNIAVDLGAPLDVNYDGIVFDHHPDHPTERKYELIWETCPTGLVIYHAFKEMIKPEDTWLVIGSLCGDGQPELIPDEIWKYNPNLLQGRGYMKEYGGKIYAGAYPIFSSLSSGINSLHRLGFPEQALNLLDNVRDPMELLENAEIKDAQERVRQEEATVIKNKPVIEAVDKWITLVRMRTSKPDIKLGGIFGAKLASVDNSKTYIILNETSGDISIRGVFAKYVCNQLTRMGYKAGGHAGFAGCKVDIVKIPDFIKDVRKIRL